ncbi:MAG: NifU family protein [Candidatus Enteromonas sp.]|nr:NifU family protein [Candidatus Enteromonas sp.]MDY6094524.1 NifU family protein [Candidatus Enteromonas sp.]
MEDEAQIRLIEATIDKVRPFLQRDGGDIEFVGFRDGIVYVTMVGACQGCIMAGEDISSGVEIILMEEVPGVMAVRHENIPDDLMAEYVERKSQAILDASGK